MEIVYDTLFDRAFLGIDICFTDEDCPENAYCGDGKCVAEEGFKIEIFRDIFGDCEFIKKVVGKILIRFKSGYVRDEHRISGCKNKIRMTGYPRGQKMSGYFKNPIFLALYIPVLYKRVKVLYHYILG